MQLSISATAGKRYVPFLRAQIVKAEAIAKSSLEELSIALVGDARMSQLHKQFMNIPGPTDVLTFPLDQDAKGRATSGEIVICVPEAARRASERGGKVQHELLLYAIHGLLHLCGYDDRTARDFRRIHRAEDMILTKLGVGPVFKDTRAARGTRR